MGRPHWEVSLHSAPAVTRAHVGGPEVSEDSPDSTETIGDGMLLTVKELAEQLHIKPATLYAWAAHDKIPCLRIHGLLRFDRQTIHDWLRSFGVSKHDQGLRFGLPNRTSASVDALIASAKRAAYTARHGETRPKSSLIGKEECDGAREA